MNRYVTKVFYFFVRGCNWKFSTDVLYNALEHEKKFVPDNTTKERYRLRICCLSDNFIICTLCGQRTPLFTEGFLVLTVVHVLFMSVSQEAVKGHQICWLRRPGLWTTMTTLSLWFITNEMHNSYNQFLFYSFLSALCVSNESSRSLSEARHNILYYTVWYSRAIRRV